MTGRVLVAGEAAGEALVTHDALSFWGGYDFHTGEIIDRHHPLAGQYGSLPERSRNQTPVCPAACAARNAPFEFSIR